MRAKAKGGSKEKYLLYAAIAAFCLLFAYLFTVVHAFKSMDHSGHDHSGHSQHSSSQGSSSSSSSSMSHGDMMMMPMWFQASIDTVLWLEPWHTKSWPAYIAALLGLVVFGILHEALASHRVQLSSRGKPRSPVYAAMEEEGPGMAMEGPIADVGSLRSRAYSSLLYACNLATGYLLMLAVMTYNVGVFLAVVVGMGLGHFLCFTMPWHRHHVRVDSCCETLMQAEAR